MKRHQRQVFVAVALVINKQGQLLMARRHDPKNKGMHGRWEFPGGKIEFGEKPVQTVVRETREEVGLQVAAVRLLNNYSWFHPDRSHVQVFLLAYIARAQRGEKAVPHCKEVSDVAWVSVDTALGMNVIENNKTILRDLKKSLKEKPL